MIHKGNSKTGWVAYCHTYREKHPDAIIDYKTLMQQYIKGEPV